MRTGRGTTVGVVTELVDVEGTLGVGIMALDVPRDGGGRVFVGLLEGDGAGDVGVTTEDSNCGGGLVGQQQLQKRMELLNMNMNMNMSAVEAELHSALTTQVQKRSDSKLIGPEWQQEHHHKVLKSAQPRVGAIRRG